VETTLATLPGSVENERLLVVLVQCAATGSRMELRQQSFGEGIGWFTQSSVTLEPGQVAGLKNALGAPSRGVGTQLPRQFGQLSAPAWQPRIVAADSA
jgi:hypothetical protein